jgi:hypothetical protein
MIAVISSTLQPASLSGHDGPRTNLDASTRLAQTVASVRSLQALGCAEIFLADNSSPALAPDIVRQLAPARVFHFGHFPYRNKGVAEAFLLLALLPELPSGQPIVKLSGRYTLSLDLAAQLGDADLAGLFARPGGRVENLSTRAYAVRNREFFARFLQGSLNELYASPWRIVGPRSLASVLRRAFGRVYPEKPYYDPTASLEISAARWLARSGAIVRRLERIGVTGVLGSWVNPTVSE